MTILEIRAKDPLPACRYLMLERFNRLLALLNNRPARRYNDSTNQLSRFQPDSETIDQIIGWQEEQRNGGSRPPADLAAVNQPVDKYRGHLELTGVERLG